jgi:CRP-like cAMP-binding protein
MDSPLRRITPFVDRLTLEERSALEARLTVLTLEDGVDALSAGDPSGAVFFVLDGLAQVISYALDGRLVIHRELGPGEMFGELAALDGAPRSASVTARGRCRLGALSPADFRRMRREQPGFAEALTLHLVAMIRASTERLFEHGALDMRRRLLCELRRRALAASPGDAARLSPPPRHADLAASIGTHREAVTKALSEFGRRGLVVRARGALEVPSIEALEAEIGL